MCTWLPTDFDEFFLVLLHLSLWFADFQDQSAAIDGYQFCELSTSLLHLKQLESEVCPDWPRDWYPIVKRHSFGHQRSDRLQYQDHLDSLHIDINTNFISKVGTLLLTIIIIKKMLVGLEM